MVLKAKIANKIVADDNGYTTGEIIDINEIDEHSEKEGKKEVFHEDYLLKFMKTNLDISSTFENGGAKPS